MAGTVFLVGAGPGDPELLTVKAARVLERADVVLYDRLISPEVLRLTRPGALLECVGKAPCGRGWTQDDIHRELVTMAQRFQTVVRLKGGDPFVFGRGGEEALALYQAGIPVEIVAGLSSAFSAPALAFVPVTHRGVSASVFVVEGHDPDRLEWPLLARTEATLVFLMAVQAMPVIAKRLIDLGKSSRTPVAIIERASTAEERVTKTTLGEISGVSRWIRNPAVIVVGNTAAVLPTGEELRQDIPGAVSNE